MKKDRLTLTTNLVLALLVVYLGSLVLGSMKSSGEENRRPSGDRQTMRIDMERTSLESYLGHYPPDAGDLNKMASFLTENPDNSAAFLSLGDVHYGEGELSMAVASYRQAVEINRRFCDTGDPAYHGEKLNDLVQEGLKVYKRERSMRPEDTRVRQTVKDLYFLQRSLAGGCD